MAVEPHWPWLDPIADAVNPLLGIILFAHAAMLLRAGRRREGIGLAVTLVVMLAVAYGLAYFDRVLGVFPLFGLDFSTHGAVHLAAWSALLVWRPRRWAWAIGIALLYFTIMVAQGNHTAFDLLATFAVVGLPLTLLATAIRPLARPRADSAAARQNVGP